LPEQVIPKRLDITDSFFIKAEVKGLKEVQVRCNEILYIEAGQNYVFIHMVNQRKHFCHNTMKEMEESLPIAHFIRVHKSFIINYNQVTSIEGKVIVLDGKQKVLIGITYRKAFFDRKNQKMIKKHKAHFLPSDYNSGTGSMLLLVVNSFINCYELFEQSIQTMMNI